MTAVQREMNLFCFGGAWVVREGKLVSRVKSRHWVFAHLGVIAKVDSKPVLMELGV